MYTCNDRRKIICSHNGDTVICGDVRKIDIEFLCNSYGFYFYLHIMFWVVGDICGVKLFYWPKKWKCWSHSWKRVITGGSGVVRFL